MPPKATDCHKRWQRGELPKEQRCGMCVHVWEGPKMFNSRELGATARQRLGVSCEGEIAAPALGTRVRAAPAFLSPTEELRKQR